MKEKSTSDKKELEGLVEVLEAERKELADLRKENAALKEWKRSHSGLNLP